jgi:hypothetical protein
MKKTALLFSLLSSAIFAQPQTPEGFEQSLFAGYPEIKSLTGLSASPDGVVFAAQDLNAAWGQNLTAVQSLAWKIQMVMAKPINSLNLWKT